MIGRVFVEVWEGEFVDVDEVAAVRWDEQSVYLVLKSGTQMREYADGPPGNPTRARQVLQRLHDAWAKSGRSGAS